MGTLRLFHYDQETAREITPAFADQERSLHVLVEKHLGIFFGVSLVAHEYNTGRGLRGQIDTLGLDENGCPVIIEFKRRANENVITQGLYYLDWLLDHQSEFRALVFERLGEDAAGSIDFSCPRIICVAADFSRFDERAVNQIDRFIELVRYRLYEDDMLLLETVNSPVIPFLKEYGQTIETAEDVGMPLPLQSRLKSMNSETEKLYFSTMAFAEAIGEDVSVRFLKHYVALARRRNFTCIQPARGFLKLWLNLDPEEISLEDGFSRDVRDIGHHASGNVEIELRTQEDLLKAQPLIELAYQKN